MIRNLKSLRFLVIGALLLSLTLMAFVTFSSLSNVDNLSQVQHNLDTLSDQRSDVLHLAILANQVSDTQVGQARQQVLSALGTFLDEAQQRHVEAFQNFLSDNNSSSVAGLSKTELVEIDSQRAPH